MVWCSWWWCVVIAFRGGPSTWGHWDVLIGPRQSVESVKEQTKAKKDIPFKHNREGTENQGVTQLVYTLGHAMQRVSHCPLPMPCHLHHVLHCPLRTPCITPCVAHAVDHAVCRLRKELRCLLPMPWVALCVALCVACARSCTACCPCHVSH